MLHLFALLVQAAPQVAHVAQQAPWDWALDHIHLIGWPVLVGIAWTVRGYFNKITNQFNTAVGQINTMATNHFPHMEASLAKQDIYLENIDKNIARLADKQ